VKSDVEMFEILHERIEIWNRFSIKNGRICRH